MLLDTFLPEYHFNEVHSISIKAGQSRIYSAIKDVRARDIPLFRELMGLRALPALVLRRAKRTRTSPRHTNNSLLEDVLGSGTFITLADAPDRELVVGSIGKFWQLSGSMARLSQPDDFLSAHYDDYARAAMNFRVYKSRRTGALKVRTETRILIPDPVSRRKFAAYWLIIRPGSALIRRMWLGAIKRLAER